MSLGLLRATGRMMARITTTVRIAQTSMRVPSTSRMTSTATTLNQMVGLVPSSDIAPKSAMPAIEPMMSMA